MDNSKFLKMINSKLGEDTIYTMSGDRSSRVQPISTGIPSLDYSLGVGGWPLGRLVEIYGNESSGKTTLALKTVATFQKMAKDENHFLYGKKVVFLDMENALDPVHMEALDVDTSEESGVFVSQPYSGEEAYDLANTLVNSGHVGLIIIDSLPYMVPKKMLEGSAEDNHVALQARLNSYNIPKLNKAAVQNNCTVIIINQLRINVGQMYGKLISCLL